MLEHVVIINDASQAKGGATGLALLAARLFRARGLRVSYIAGDAGENAELSALGVEIHAAGGERLNTAGASGMRAGLHNGASAAMMAKFIAENDTPGTVYHLHGWAQIHSPAIFSALQAVAARTIVHAHDFFLACPNGTYTDFPRTEVCEKVPMSLGCIATQCDKRRYLHKLWRMARFRRLRRQFDTRLPWAGIAMIHPDMKRFFLRTGYPEPLLNAVRNPVLPFCTERVKAEENSRFVFVGRVEPEKGVANLVAAADLAGVPHTIVGDGPMCASLKASRPDIEFMGWQNRPEIGETIARARALVLPSLTPEPFGLVVPEASESGVPVILGESALLSTDVVRGRVGIMPECVRDPASLARAMAEIRDMPAAEIRQMSERAASRSAGLAATPECWADRLTELFEAALARTAKG